MNFYKTRRWRRKRRAILDRDNHECQECKKRGEFSRGIVVHHVRHLDARPDLALADDNLLTVCERCHNQLHPEKFGQEEAAKRRQLTPERW